MPRSKRRIAKETFPLTPEQQADREVFVRDNAMSLLEQRDALIVRQRKAIADLETSRRSLRAENARLRREGVEQLQAAADEIVRLKAEGLAEIERGE